MKKGILLFTAVIILICCSFVITLQLNESSNLDLCIYKSDNVKVLQLGNDGEIKYVDYQFASQDEDEAYEKNTVILTGVASNVRQAMVSYEYLDAEVVDNITIFDITISEVLSCRTESLDNKTVISVGIPYNMYNYGEGLPIVEEGKSYLLFCYMTADKDNDVLEMDNYVDCWMSNPRELLCEKVDNYYVASEFFAKSPAAYNVVELINVQNIESVNGLDSNTINNSVIVLKERTQKDSTEIENIMRYSYLIECSSLEKYICDVLKSKGM